MIYLHFNDPSPKPLAEEPPSRSWTIIRKILQKIIPEANSDFDELIGEVVYWKIEFNEKENATWREIGFNSNGDAIVAMPLGNNCGYWVDNQLTMMDYQAFDPKVIGEQEFEDDWNAFKDSSGLGEPDIRV